MLNLALVGALAGTLALGPVTGDDDKKKSTGDDTPKVENATPGVFETAAPDAQPIIADTYALGRSSDASPIKFWASYAYGQADKIWETNGESGELTVAGSRGDIVSQRANVGAQINVIQFPAFTLGAGAQLTVAKNEFVVDEGGAMSPFTNGIGDIESSFGLQGVKVFGEARGRVFGVHGGYVFDLGEEREFGPQATANTPFGNLPLSQNAQGDIQPTPLVAGNATYQPLLLPTALSNSDGRDAIFGGVDFDYPSDRFRLFGGVDYFALQGIEDNPSTASDESALDGDDLVNFMLGGGLRLGVVEVGAAFQIQSRIDNPTVENIGTEEGIGGHATTIAPYLRISPPSLPATIFVKGAVQEEYTEYGYAIAGANSVKPQIGFTAGISVGFE